MIDIEEKGQKTICRLESEDKSLKIEISSGLQSLAFIESDDFDFSEILTGDEKRVRLNQLGLRLRGEANLTNITDEDFSIVLFDDAVIYATEPWTDQPQKIFEQ